MHYKKPWLPLGVVRVRGRGYLPHWEMSEAVYSITYGLHDSLPPKAVSALREERRALRGSLSTDLRLAFERALDRSLDRARGAAYLSDNRIAGVVAENLAHFDGLRYRLFAWCIMPTHVHVVLRAHAGLSGIIQSWKSYTAKEANRILGRTGPFWAREYFDRIVRNEEDLSRTVEYVVRNPVRAGLVDWKWVWTAR
jgi:REP element-mobilizing transposase RayT